MPEYTLTCVLTMARQLTEIERIKYARTVRRDHKRSNHVSRGGRGRRDRQKRRTRPTDDHWGEQKRDAW